MTKIVDSSGYGAELNGSQYDNNVNSTSGVNVARTTTTEAVTIADQNDTLEFSNASAIAVTLDPISTINAVLQTSDFKVTLKNIGVGIVTYTCGGTDTLEDGSTSDTLAQYESVTLQTDSTKAKWNKKSNLYISSLTGVTDSNNTATEVVNTTTETDIYSYSITANTGKAGGTFRLTIVGDYLNNTAGGAAFSIGVSLGATDIIAASTTFVTSSFSPTRIPVKMVIDIPVIGSSSQSGLVKTNFATSIVSGWTSPAIYTAFNNAMTEDLTTALILAVSVKHGTADAAISFIKRGAVLEYLPAP